MIYLDNAATTYKKPQAVIDAVLNAMSGMGNCARGAHNSALSAARIIHETREMLASFFGCSKPDHVIFTSNSTEALNTSINGVINPGDHVISSDLEHNSVLRPLYHLKQTQSISLDFVRADQKGNIDYSDFEKLITPKTRAIITTHASNLTGNVLDIKRIGAIAKAHGLIYIVDASQTAGSFNIDMSEQNLDILCFTGHKGLMGPQGTGGLCISDEIKIRPLKTGGTGIFSFSESQPDAYPEALEAGTLNGHGIAGLNAALKFIQDNGVENIHNHEITLMNHFLSAIKDILGITVYGDFSSDRAPIVTINVADYDSGYIADILAQDFDIAVRAGAHCAPRMHNALGTHDQGAVRFSFGWFNTLSDVHSAISALRSIADE